MTWTKLAYGTIIATALVGGPTYYAVRSIVTAYEAAILAEGVQEHWAAARAVWPFATNATPYAGWEAGYYGYLTNYTGAAMWNFNDYRASGNSAAKRIPLFGSVFPRQAINESLRQIEALVPYFVKSTTFTNDMEFSPIYWTQSNLWATLNIGDGTSLWTVAFSTNGMPIYSNRVGSTLCTSTMAEAWRVLNALTTTVREVSYVAASGSVACVSYGTNRWDLEESWGVYDLPLDPLPALPDNFTPPNSALDYPLVQALSTYDYSELSGFGPKSISYAGQAGESTVYNINLEAQLRRVVAYTNWPDQALIHDLVFITTTDGGTNKIATSKAEHTYKLAMPTFPEGVAADITAVNSVKAVWTINHPRWEEAEYTTYYGPSTNFLSYGAETQTFRVVFAGALATNVFTNIVMTVSPSITNWIPAGLLSFQAEKFYLWPESWDNYAGYPQGWRTYYFYSGAAEAIWTGQYPTSISVSTPTVSGSVIDDHYGPVLLIDWTFKNR